MRSLLYLIAVLVSLFLLLLFGALAGGLVLAPAGTIPSVLGATTGAVVAICVWFKLVGYFVEQEDIHLSNVRPHAAPEAPPSVNVGPPLSARDVRRGNHLMACGIVTFFSALFSTPGIALLVGAAGIVSAVAGFVISLTAAEFPAEDGVVRRVKLLVARTRT
ncbi:MAG: hypothetical protein ABW208_12110 [Pyrinomonadaceae bacterium]